MAPERRNQFIFLAVLLVALAVMTYRAMRPSAVAAPASNERGGRAQAARTAPAGPQAPDVHLPALEAPRPAPAPGDRNPFRFKPKPPPPAPPPTEQFTPPPAPVGPPPGPTVAPINLKFIGVVEPGEGKPKIAALSDQAGHVFQGTEGAIIEGRWKIWRIGTESLEISYLDGTGRRTIRLTGG